MYDNDFRSWLTYLSDQRDCVEMLRAGSKSFYAASLLLPKSFRVPTIALYAFCRVADDDIDQLGAGPDALAALYRRLDDVYAGRPRNTPVDRAFANVVHAYGIPRTIPAALFEGFAWDLNNRRYDSMSELYAYSARVAGTVGTMMALIMGIRDPAILSRACDLGVAMQLTNIARDVGEDARAGRVYLPVELLSANGIDAEAFLAEPAFSPALAPVVAAVLDSAERLYRRADWGLTKLPAACRPAMFAASAIYAEIGNEVRRRGFDSVTGRAVVAPLRKAALLGQALRDALRSCEQDEAPMLQEVRFLVDAVGRS